MPATYPQAIGDRIIQNIRVHTPGALDDAIKLELFNVVDEFLRETETWRVIVQFTTVANKQDYTIGYSNNTIITRINEIYSLNNAIHIPVGGYFISPYTLRLNTIPSSGGDLVYLDITLTTTEPVKPDGFSDVPNWIWSRYSTIFEYGTISKLLTQSGKPYTSPQLAVVHYGKFRMGMSKAKTDYQTGFLKDGQAWAFPQSFATTRTYRGSS